MKKNIVIFGASGDTGKYFIDYFLQHNLSDDYQLVAVGSRECPYFSKINVPYHRVDITNEKNFGCLPSQAYAIVDFAGIMPARMTGYSPQRYIDVNISGTLNILEYCRRTHADRFLYMQSFGDIKDHAEKSLVLHTDMPRKFSFANDHTIYVMTKNFAVDMAENYYEMYGLKRFIFRLPTIYLWSPIDSFNVDGKPRKIGYRYLIDRAISGEPIEVWGNPERLKDMIYVKDFCQMVYKSIFVDRNSGYYNVGTGIGTSLKKQIEGMIDIFGTVGHHSQIVMR
ncbi:MAG: NAD-dependent epimerase/dehydratase family protein, partial [Lentisphaerae bacterium]|nr:NAD-dependent epimerase/dehydratase family protein [Lentisphaerota bacterium]